MAFLLLALAGGNRAVCAGWLPTPEARMSCCAKGRECPMHKGGLHESHSQRPITQAEADSCCAWSERERSNSSGPTFVAEISSPAPNVSTVLTPPAPALVRTDSWRTDAPIPIAPVPKHVLLSVFLV